LPRVDVTSAQRDVMAVDLAPAEIAAAVDEDLPAMAAAPAGAAKAPEPKQMTAVDKPALSGNDRRSREVAPPRAPVVNEPAPKPSAAEAAVAGKTQSVVWIRQQPGNHFTLQLFATSSRDKRDQFVAQQTNPERFATFETRRNGVAWYAVIYGNFATRAEANAATASLPSAVGRVEPWIRTFASVQATIH